jgi:hypothetical protein
MEPRLGTDPGMTRPRAIVSQFPVTDLKTQAEAVAFSIAWPGREVEPAAGRAMTTMIRRLRASSKDIFLKISLHYGGRPGAARAGG